MRRMLLSLMLAVAAPAWAGDVKLKLHGIGISGKTLYVALHSSAADFPMRSGTAINHAIVAKGDDADLTIQNIPNGEYAVAAYVDMNSNGVLDSNIFGIPREPVGVSRNAKGRFGPPKFSDASFKVGDGVTTLAIELK